MARTKFKITKLTGTGGMVVLDDYEKKDLYRWLDKLAVSSRRSRESDNWIKLKEVVSTEVYESITTGLEDEVKAVQDFASFKLWTTDNSYIYEADLLLRRPNLTRAKDAFKKILCTSSTLDGLRGKTDGDDVRYTLAVDVGAGHGYLAEGIHRLVRLAYGFHKYKLDEDI